VIPAQTPAAAELGEILHELHAAYMAAAQGDAGEDCLLTSAVVRLLGTMLQKVSAYRGSEAVERRIHFIHSIQICTQEHFRSNLTTEKIAAELGYNKSYFCKLFKQHLGMSFLQYVNEYRIQYAMLWCKEYPLTQIAEEVGFRDYSYFARVFKKYTGMTIIHYINHVKIQHACEALLHTNDSITNIALSVGFSTSIYFCKIFKKLVGCTPSEYRNAIF